MFSVIDEKKAQVSIRHIRGIGNGIPLKARELFPGATFESGFVRINDGILEFDSNAKVGKGEKYVLIVREYEQEMPEVKVYSGRRFIHNAPAYTELWQLIPVSAFYETA